MVREILQKRCWSAAFIWFDIPAAQALLHGSTSSYSRMSFIQYQYLLTSLTHDNGFNIFLDFWNAHNLLVSIYFLLVPNLSCINCSQTKTHHILIQISKSKLCGHITGRQHDHWNWPPLLHGLRTRLWLFEQSSQDYH